MKLKSIQFVKILLIWVLSAFIIEIILKAIHGKIYLDHFTMYEYHILYWKENIMMVIVALALTLPPTILFFISTFFIDNKWIYIMISILLSFISFALFLYFLNKSGRFFQDLLTPSLYSLVTSVLILLFRVGK